MERLQRITYEVAKLAYELGYSWKEDINYYYFEDKLVRDYFVPPFGNQATYLAPNVYLLADWIRETYNLHIFSMYDNGFAEQVNHWDFKIQEVGGNIIVDSGYYKTTADAINEGIARAIHIIKHKELNKDMK